MIVELNENPHGLPVVSFAMFTSQEIGGFQLVDRLNSELNIASESYFYAQKKFGKQWDELAAYFGSLDLAEAAYLRYDKQKCEL